MFILTILEKIKKKRLIFFQGIVTSSWKMVNYQEARVKLINAQLIKLESSAENKARTTLRLNTRNFEDY